MVQDRFPRHKNDSIAKSSRVSSFKSYNFYPRNDFFFLATLSILF